MHTITRWDCRWLPVPHALLLLPCPSCIPRQSTADCKIAPEESQICSMHRFDLPYMALPLPTDILRAWEHPPSASTLGMALPQRNHFIPTDFSLRAPSADGGKDARAKQAAEAILTAVPNVAAKVCLPCHAFL